MVTKKNYGNQIYCDPNLLALRYIIYNPNPKNSAEPIVAVLKVAVNLGIYNICYNILYIIYIIYNPNLKN